MRRWCIGFVVQLPGGHAIDFELDAITEPAGEHKTGRDAVNRAALVCIATSNATSNGIPGTGWDSLVPDRTTTAETSGRTGLVGTRRNGKGRWLATS